MPRRGPSNTYPDWDSLFEQASSCAGYVDLATARAAGFSNQLIHYYVANGRLERAARGVYRLARFPASDREDLVVLWLWSKREGTFSHETALNLQDLSDSMPAIRHMTVPASWESRRLRVPKGAQLHFADVNPEDRQWAGPVPVTSHKRTLSDCLLAHVAPDLIDQAGVQAVQRGLISKIELEQLLQDQIP